MKSFCYIKKGENMKIEFKYQVDYVRFLQEIGFSFPDSCYFIKEAIKGGIGSHTILIKEFKEKYTECGLNVDDYLRAYTEIRKDIKDIPFDELHYIIWEEETCY